MVCNGSIRSKSWIGGGSSSNSRTAATTATTSITTATTGTTTATATIMRTYSVKCGGYVNEIEAGDLLMADGRDQFNVQRQLQFPWSGI